VDLQGTVAAGLLHRLGVLSVTQPIVAKHALKEYQLNTSCTCTY